MKNLPQDKFPHFIVEAYGKRLIKIADEDALTSEIIQLHIHYLKNSDVSLYEKDGGLFRRVGEKIDGFVLEKLVSQFSKNKKVVFHNAYVGILIEGEKSSWIVCAKKNSGPPTSEELYLRFRDLTTSALKLIQNMEVNSRNTLYQLEKTVNAFCFIGEYLKTIETVEEPQKRAFLLLSVLLLDAGLNSDGVALFLYDSKSSLLKGYMGIDKEEINLNFQDDIEDIKMGSLLCRNSLNSLYKNSRYNIENASFNSAIKGITTTTNNHNSLFDVIKNGGISEINEENFAPNNLDPFLTAISNRILDGRIIKLKRIESGAEWIGVLYMDIKSSNDRIEHEDTLIEFFAGLVPIILKTGTLNFVHKDIEHTNTVMSEGESGRRKHHLFYTFLIIFIVTFAVTILGILEVITIKEKYLTPLFGASILELAGVVVALFRGTSFFK